MGHCVAKRNRRWVENVQLLASSELDRLTIILQLRLILSVEMMGTQIINRKAFTPTELLVVKGTKDFPRRLAFP